MPLWRKLYNTVWLAFFSCVLIPRWTGPRFGPIIHMLLGILLLLVTLSNARRLATIAVPPRLQRVSKVTAGFSLFQVIVGLAIGAAIHLAPQYPFIIPTLRGIHVVCALAILAQASSVATAYDMWEEKEFTAAPSSAAENR
jgi:hypothetical protein